MAENEMNIPAGESAEASNSEQGITETSAADTTIHTNAETNTANDEASAGEQAAPESTEEITYHAVERDGQVAAIWEMQGRKHLRTIDPRSRMGQEILRLYTSEHHDDIHTTADAAAAQ